MSEADAGAGFDVAISWRGRRAQAHVPRLLAERDLELTTATAIRAAVAAADVNAAAAAMPDFAPLARLLLRAEGVASSYIEGVAAPLADIVVAEDAHGPSSTAAWWIAANLEAVTAAVAAAPGASLDVDTLCAWHRMVMRGSPLPGRYIGAVRPDQGWIGGASPLDAALVTPPPERLPALLDDLIAFANRSDIDPIAQAAIAHAQFEIIHPFGDSNGRVGRVLISWLLTRRLALVTPPPVSIRIASDRAGYLSGLTLFRLGQHEPWVRWFADVVTGAGEAQRALVVAVERIRSRWREQLAVPTDGRIVRRDALAWRLLDLLPRHLVLTSTMVAAEQGVSTRAATNALNELVAAGVLVEHVPRGHRGPGRPARHYVSPELLAVAGSG